MKLTLLAFERVESAACHLTLHSTEGDAPARSITIVDSSPDEDWVGFEDAPCSFGISYPQPQHSID